MGAQVFEAGLEPREPLVAAFGGELALLEGLVVALERLLGTGDLRANRREPLLDLRTRPCCILFGLRQRLCHRFPVAEERGELLEHGVFELLAGEAFVAAGLGSVPLAAAAGVVLVAAAVAAGEHADVGLAATAAADDAGEEKVGGVAAAAGDVLAALAQDRLRALEGELVDKGSWMPSKRRSRQRILPV